MDETLLNDDLIRKILHDNIRQMVKHGEIQGNVKLWQDCNHTERLQRMLEQENVKLRWDYSPTERLQRMLEEAISMIAEEIMKKGAK